MQGWDSYFESQQDTHYVYNILYINYIMCIFYYSFIMVYIIIYCIYIIDTFLFGNHIFLLNDNNVIAE